MFVVSLILVDRCYIALMLVCNNDNNIDFDL